MYIEPPRFSQQFSELALQHGRKPSGSFERFGSRGKMMSYFQSNRERAVRLEREIEEDYDYGEGVDLSSIIAGAPEMHRFDHDDQDQHGEGICTCHHSSSFIFTFVFSL